MAYEGQERDPRALPLAATGGESRRVGRPLGGGYGSSEWRERGAVPWQPKGSSPTPIYTIEQQAQIAELFQKALDGELSSFRKRELKVNEPERLNERHLQMVSMRATGLHQRLIAKTFGDNDLYVHQILNHPDAVYLMSQMMAMRATNGNEFQERMEALAEPAMSAIEDALLSDEPDTIKIALKKAPLAFRVLEQGGKIKRPAAQAEVNHNHRLEASPAQMQGLREALLEARELRDVKYTVIEVGEESREVRTLSAEGGDAAGSRAGIDEGLSSEDEAPEQETRLVSGWDD